MNINLDLRPIHVKRQDSLTRKKLITTLVLCTYIITIGCLYVKIHRENIALGTELEELKKDEKMVDESQKIMLFDLEQVSDEKTAQITSLTKDEILWSVLLTNIADSMPKDIYITEYNASSSLNIQITGSTKNISDLLFFKQQLKFSKYYSTVNLKQLTPHDDRYNFLISLRMSQSITEEA